MIMQRSQYSPLKVHCDTRSMASKEQELTLSQPASQPHKNS